VSLRPGMGSEMKQLFYYQQAQVFLLHRTFQKISRVLNETLLIFHLLIPLQLHNLKSPHEGIYGHY